MYGLSFRLPNINALWFLGDHFLEIIAVDKELKGSKIIDSTKYNKEDKALGGKTTQQTSFQLWIL